MLWKEDVGYWCVLKEIWIKSLISICFCKFTVEKDFIQFNVNQRVLTKIILSPGFVKIDSGEFLSL